MIQSLDWGQAVSWIELTAAPRHYAVAFPESLKSRLARELDVVVFARIEADVRTSSWLDGVLIEIAIAVEAERLCGLTLDPYVESVRDEMRVRLAPANSTNAPADELGPLVIDLDAEDPPEIVHGREIDLSHYVYECLALAISPFPRKPDAEFAPVEPTESMSPFAALASLVTKAGQGEGHG